MYTSLPVRTFPEVDPEFLATLGEWCPREGERPGVEVEIRPDGLRVKLTYLGVESGLLFGWGSRVSRTSVYEALDRVHEVLSWRVIRPPFGS